jgi:hypothetical protein
MAELFEARAAPEPPAVERTGSIGQANRRLLDFLFGAQRVLLEESVFAVEEWLDRARTETHLFAELISKLAVAHSVNNLKTMYEECGQHQIDFIRRDCDRVFTHSRRMIEAVSKLADKA